MAVGAAAQAEAEVRPPVVLSWVDCALQALRLEAGAARSPEVAKVVNLTPTQQGRFRMH